jgi:hypothetical protein
MQYPVDVAWDGARILVRDTNLEKVVSFDASGRFLASRALSPLVTDRMSLAGTDTLVGGVQLGRQLRAVLRLGGARPDTVLRFTLPQQLRLRTQGSPSLTLSPPYASITRWAALPDRGLAFWDARQPQVQVLDRAGRVKARLPLPSGNYPVTRADRESWLATAIPPSFMGKPVFEPLREYARGSVQFPARLPAVLDLVTDPSGGVWIRRTTPATGEVWTLLRNGGGGPTFRLGRGSRLLVVGEREVAVIATDENDVERVDIYAKPPGTVRPAT